MQRLCTRLGGSGWVGRGAGVSMSIIITQLEAMVGSLVLASYSKYTACWSEQFSLTQGKPYPPLLIYCTIQQSCRKFQTPPKDCMIHDYQQQESTYLDTIQNSESLNTQVKKVIFQRFFHFYKNLGLRAVQYIVQKHIIKSVCTMDNELEIYFPFYDEYPTKYVLQIYDSPPKHK